MENDTLLRRISAATEQKKQSTPDIARTPIASLHPSTIPEGQNHLDAPVRQTVAAPSLEPRLDGSIQNRPPEPHPSKAPASAAQASNTPPSSLDQAQTFHNPELNDLLDPYASQSAAQAYLAETDAEAIPEPEEEDLLIFKPQPQDEIKSNPNAPNRLAKEDRPEAHVIACDGNIAVVQGDTACVDTISGLTWAVGRMLSISVGKSRIVGMICDIKMPEGHFDEDKRSILHFKLELQGEVTDDENGGKPKFVKGITLYPGVGSIVHQIRAEDLASIYASTGSNNGVIGTLSQDSSIPALVDVTDMLSKHFAVLGSTGCGKSASVSLLLHCAQELVPDLRTVILDPHNEYTRAFPDANTVEQKDLDLPFWMFHLEEYAEVLFRGKPIVHEEIDALREFIPLAKTKFKEGEDRLLLRQASSSKSITADTPCPYRMADLVSIVDDEMGLLESRYDKSILKSLKARITGHSNDARYLFMFRHKTIEDIAEQVIGHFFCLPGNGSLTTIIQMAGMPAEVVNSVASVLCRLSFELAIAAKGLMKVLVVCEEAHRYVPAGKDGFEPTRRAIARIAKEGRKYGSFMAIISQRPSELDPTILSQCSTVFSLRLTNDYDQDIVRRAISSSSASTIAFISSLSNRECIAFGEGMSTPMRMKFRNLPKAWLPGADADVFGNSTPVVDATQSNAVFQSWRKGTA